jgi:FkbM family methyltransferase
MDGTWEPRVTAAAQSAITAGTCVVNVGADLGYYVLLAASQNPTGCILAFEPNSVHQNHLDRNVKVNELHMVKIVRAALGNSSERAFLRRDEARIETGNAMGVVGEWVPQFRFDDLPEVHDIPDRPRVGLVIIDVEGAELHVLKGMERTLVRDRPDLLIEVHGTLMPYFGSAKAELMSWLHSQGYVSKWIDGEAIEHPGNSHILFRHA